MIDGVCGVEVVPGRAPLAGDSPPAAGIDLRLIISSAKSVIMSRRQALRIPIAVLQNPCVVRGLSLLGSCATVLIDCEVLTSTGPFMGSHDRSTRAASPRPRTRRDLRAAPTREPHDGQTAVVTRWAASGWKQTRRAIQMPRHEPSALDSESSRMAVRRASAGGVSWRCARQATKIS